MPIEVEDPGDPRVQRYCGLTDRALRQRLEAEHGIFVVEGARAVRQLVDSDWKVGSLLLLASRLEGLADLLATVDAPVYVASPEVFDQIAGYPVHRGVLALAARRPDPPLATLLDGVELILAVEGVNDHENLGALFRNAAAFGVGAVLLDPTCCDPLYRRAVRVSVGQVLRIPFARGDPLAVVAGAGVTLVALDPAAGDPIEDLAVAPPVALLVGSEGDGLSPAARAAATRHARITMAPSVDSLNVATAAAVALHQIRLSWRR